jgi:hypothetical protein
MSGMVEREAQRRARRRSAALEDAYRQIAVGGLERETQAGRRRLALRFARAEHGDASPAGLGGGGEALQLGVARAMEPDEQRPAPCATQHLLRRPKRIAPTRRAHDGEMRQIDAGGCQRRRIRQMRRREPDDAFPRPRECRQRGHQDLQLTYAPEVAEEFGQRPARPAAARKLRVEHGMAAGDDISRLRECRAAPDGVSLEKSIEGRHGTV